MVKAIGYVRQSTLKQQSLATQKSLIIEIAKQYGWYNVTFYFYLKFKAMLFILHTKTPLKLDFHVQL
ncbi:recombinase family protein [Nosocomiicoccus sp. HMSC059G07]|uniref:recombinase family protein n=1 Tax=Nosocomiicoccus sp. HMSC059G07 TaxID=1739531 RepID=UPI0008A1B634|nr:recombinase family protein [Nosocomiicoccus sp. HMSC059G07]OFO54090.1 hypothetical protein HMPREF3029_01235 [Nosocomiicoccus sp. HMSC059G07]